MPALNAVIEDETAESFPGTRVLPTIRPVAFDCACEGFHLLRGEKIVNTIVIYGRLDKDTEQNQTRRDCDSQPRNQLNKRSQSWSDYDSEPCNRSESGSEKPHTIQTHKRNETPGLHPSLSTLNPSWFARQEVKRPRARPSTI